VLSQGVLSQGAVTGCCHSCYWLTEASPCENGGERRDQILVRMTPPPLRDLLHPREAVLRIQLLRSCVQIGATLRRPLLGLLRIGLDNAAPGPLDLVERRRDRTQPGYRGQDDQGPRTQAAPQAPDLDREDARWFLESAWHAHEALYAAFVLVLVLGLRRGEVLGLAWDQIDLDDAELYVGEQLQRVRHQLVRGEVKTETSEAPLPLPDLCVTALKVRKKQQDADRDRAGDGWIDTGLVFTTRHGTPIEPRNFGRSFDRCIIAARVPRITVHGTRKTCASLLAALDVHPRVAMRILRHSKIAVTMEIYAEAPSDATRGALRKLSNWLA
jgi:integrase